MASQKFKGIPFTRLTQVFLTQVIRCFIRAGIWHSSASYLLIQGQPDVAWKAYEQAMRLDSTRAKVHDKIDRSRTLEEKLAKKRLEDAEVPASHPRMAFEAEIAQAHQLEKVGDPKSAEQIYREILTKDPHHVEAARLLAGVAVEIKHYRDAEVLLLRAVTTAPDYTRAWVDL